MTKANTATVSTRNKNGRKALVVRHWGLEKGKRYTQEITPNGIRIFKSKDGTRACQPAGGPAFVTITAKYLPDGLNFPTYHRAQLFTDVSKDSLFIPLTMEQAANTEQAYTMRDLKAWEKQGRAIAKSLGVTLTVKATQTKTVDVL